MNKKILTLTLNPCIDKTITIDKFTYGGLNRATAVRSDIGGKGINVAGVLKNFNSDVVAVGIAGRENGSDIIEFLDKSGIENIFVYADGQVRTNYKVVDSENKITTEINEPGFMVSEAVMSECMEKITNEFPSTEIMVLAGSVPSGIDNNIYAVLINEAKKHGVKVILDADGEKLEHGISAVPYAIKPNLFEFEQLTGRKFENTEEIVSAAEKYIAMGIKIVIVSMGGDGAVFVDDKSACIAKPFRMECRSTVAAGDSMVAALAHGLVNGYDIETIARFAVASGSVTASKEGTEVCTLEEVVEKVDLVTVGEL